MQLVKWQPYMDECLQILETHPDALPSDRRLIWWAKLGYIMEQAGVQLTAEDPYSMISFSDSKTRYTIKAFAHQLAQFRREIPEEFWTSKSISNHHPTFIPTNLFPAPLAHTKYAIDLFVHESAMGVDCTEGNLSNSPGKDHVPTPAIAPLIDALTTCIRSIHQAIDCICMVSPEQLICMPTLVVARTSYPVVSLIKIYSLLTASDTRVGQVIDMQTLKVEYYLDRVIGQYQAAAALGGGRVAGKFGNIVMMLRTWFLKQKENGPELREIFGTEIRSDTPVDHQPPANKQGTTPLHLLSEVAMGDPANGSTPPGAFSHRSRPGPESNHSPATASGTLNYGSTGQPCRLNSIASSRSDPQAATWSTPSPFSQPMPATHAPHAENRAYYQPYAPNNPTQPYLVPQSSMATPQGGASADAYSNMSNVGMPVSQPMGMGPGIGMEGTFGPDMFVLNTMMEDGLLGFPPLTFDGNFQF